MPLPSPDTLVAVINARAALQTALAQALDDGHLIGALQAVTGLTRAQITPPAADAARPTETADDVYRLKSGQRLREVLADRATKPQGLNYNTLRNEFRRRLPLGSRHAANDMFARALAHALSFPPEVSGLRVVPNPPEHAHIEQRWLQYTPPGAADAAADGSQPATPTPTPSPAPELSLADQLTARMEARMAAQEAAEFG